jgi:hypothetical protein
VSVPPHGLASAVPVATVIPAGSLAPIQMPDTVKALIAGLRMTIVRMLVDPASMDAGANAAVNSGP